MDRYEREQARKMEIEALAEEVDAENIIEGPRHRTKVEVELPTVQQLLQPYFDRGLSGKNEKFEIESFRTWLTEQAYTSRHADTEIKSHILNLSLNVTRPIQFMYRVFKYLELLFLLPMTDNWTMADLEAEMQGITKWEAAGEWKYTPDTREWEIANEGFRGLHSDKRREARKELKGKFKERKANMRELNKFALAGDEDKVIGEARVVKRKNMSSKRKRRLREQEMSEMENEGEMENEDKTTAGTGTGLDEMFKTEF